MLITPEYKKLNRQLHESPKGFGADGYKHVDDVYNLICSNELENMLDYGCGQGTIWTGDKKTIGLSKRLRKYKKNHYFKYYCYDPCVLGKDKMPKEVKEYDLIVCTDVLEHIEPECLGDVLCDILGRVKKIAYFVINFMPAIKTLPDGRNAHLIQQPRKWWINVLSSSASDFFKPEIMVLDNPRSHKEFTVCVINTENMNERS